MNLVRPFLVFLILTLWIGPLSTAQPNSTPPSFIDANYYLPPNTATNQLAEQIVRELTPTNWPRESHPTLYLTAGAIASGKNRAVDGMVQQGFIPRQTLLIDPDAIKTRIPEYQRLKSLGDPLAGDKVHKLSMYIADRITEEALARGINAVYMTSLRYTPSALEMVNWVRRWYSNYKIQIISVRAPVRFLSARNQIRFAQLGRLVPEDILQASIQSVDRSVRLLEEKVDEVVTVSNDQDRPLAITYMLIRRPAARLLPVHIPLINVSEPKVTRIPHPPSFRILVSLDLDWTAYYPKNQNSHADQWATTETLKVNKGETIEEYRMTDGLQAFVNLLFRLRIPLVIQSGGERSRNEDLLRITDLGSIGNLFERSLRILSAEDLVPGTENPSRKVKDVELNTTAYRPEDIGHVDDIADYLLDTEQNKSTIALGPTYTFINDYDRWVLSQPVHRKYDPPSKEAWALERNKLAYVTGVVLESLERLEANRARNFREAILQIVRDSRGEWIHPHATEQRWLYWKGAQALKLVDSTWQKVKIPSEPCADLMTDTSTQ